MSAQAIGRSQGREERLGERFGAMAKGYSDQEAARLELLRIFWASR